ncbi:helix-turn-helix domain-containing protein, partial [Methanosarcina mazei]|uniref:helix-turn-helix domain-containing protein n=1 Tax=Methanosarcina mazei TaxID=2209 RepID=UPI00064FA67F
DKEVIEHFYENDWPGNVRELQNIIESVMNFAEGEYITLEDLHPHSGPCNYKKKVATASEPMTMQGKSLKDAVEKYEMKLIQAALEEAGYNCAKAARALNIPKQTLHGKMKRYGL